MSRALSVYLDLIRFLAATGVLFSHLYIKPFTDGLLWWRIGGYGDASVIVFFVLSGYVIAYVAATRERSGKAFFISRFSRLYSVTLIGLALTYVLDGAGISINSSLYASNRILLKPISWEGYLSSIFFVNEFQVFGFDGISPGSNSPFWSLSFEASYYLVAALLLFFPKRFSVPACVLLLWMAGRTIVALMPLWFMGFMLFQLRDRLELTKWVAWLGFAGSATFLLLMQNVMWVIPVDTFGVDFPWGVKPFKRALFGDYVVAMVFGLHLFCAQQVLDHQIQISEWIEKPIRWLGSLTFPLYCIHYPAMCFLTAVSPWAANTWRNFVFVTAGILLLVVALTPLCERLRSALRGWLTALAFQRVATG